MAALAALPRRVRGRRGRHAIVHLCRSALLCDAARRCPAVAALSQCRAVVPPSFRFFSARASGRWAQSPRSNWKRVKSGLVVRYRVKSVVWKWSCCPYPVLATPSVAYSICARKGKRTDGGKGGRRKMVSRGDLHTTNSVREVLRERQQLGSGATMTMGTVAELVFEG